MLPVKVKVFNQSECFVSEQRSYAMLKFVCDIGSMVIIKEKSSRSTYSGDLKTSGRKVVHQTYDLWLRISFKRLYSWRRKLIKQSKSVNEW